MMLTYDRKTIDSAGAFLVNELSRLDQTLHEPLSLVTWNRDICLREDVTLGDKSSAFTLTDMAASGGVNPNGKNWVGQDSTSIATMQLDTGLETTPLHLWALQLGWTVEDLAIAQQTGRPISEQMYKAMQRKYNMDVDEMVYIGDKDVGAYGLVNNPKVSVANSTLDWDTAEPEQILDDINDLIATTKTRSGEAVTPDQLRVSPNKIARLLKPVTKGSSETVLSFVTKKSLTFVETGRELNIKSLKWLKGRGVNGADRTLAYTNDDMYVRFPLVPLQHTPLQENGLFQLVTYFGKLGHVEFVYPETVGYMDGK